MTLDELKKLHESGEFHHATYRLSGVAEGLHIYARDAAGFRGYRWVGAFNNYHAAFADAGIRNIALEEAEEFLRGIKHGVSVGSFGNG